MTEYLYKDLTEKVIGISFKVFNNLGYGYREKVYQREHLQKNLKIVI